MNAMETGVWVFQGNGADAPGGIFTTQEKAETWIEKTGVEGILWKFPVDVSVYDYLVETGALKLKHEYQKDTRFIQKISPGYLPHSHYEAPSIDDETVTQSKTKE